MPKYYQHILPGSDDLGKVTTLTCIDDISDDDIILYRFADGTACNKAFIADAGNDNAFNGKYAMVELFNPNAKWTFETHEITLGETKTYTDPNTGQTYDIPAPGIQQNGQYGGSFGAGEGGIKASAKDGQLRTDATPPVYYGKRKVEADDAYILSEHPELSDDYTKIVPEKNSKHIAPASAHTFAKKEEIITTHVEEHSQPIEEIPGDVVSSITESNMYIAAANAGTSIINVDAHSLQFGDPNLYINLDEFKEDINITFNGAKYKFTNKELKELISKKDKVENNTPSDDVKFIKEYLNTEDVLITNMIEKSKKVNSDIGMDLTLAIPPKEVYNTIKNVYPEEMSSNFIKSLAYRISIKCLVDAIADGLSVYYDGSKNSIENND